MLCAIPLAILAILGIGGDDAGEYGIFSPLNETTVTMNGDINSDTKDDFDNLLADYPDLNLIIMEDCPGSNDDETNVAVSRKIHNLGIRTNLRSTSMIASGAVDMFLAGTERTMDSPQTAMIGVHSWSDQDGNEATDFAVGASEHQLYIDYYKDVGFSQAMAEDFYYFTINASPAEDIYYMTLDEINQYGVLTA